MKRVFFAVFLLFAVSSGAFAADDISGFLPPEGHPRLLITQDRIPELKARLKTETGQSIIERMEKISQPYSEKEARKQNWDSFRPYMRMRGITTEASLDCVRYLAYGDKKAARHAITEILDTLRKAAFPTHNDLSRANGALMFTAALVYDWCYPMLEETEKQEYVKELIRCANRMECGYEKFRYNAICGHSSERMLLKDLLGTGIAIYDEYPDMYIRTRDVIARDFIPVRNHLFKGHSYHQGTNYMNARMEGDLTCYLIFEAMGAGRIFDDDLREVLYEVIYRRRGDNLLLKAGDCSQDLKAKKVYSTIMCLGAGIYKDPYLQYEFEMKPACEPAYLMFELLFRDFDLKGKAPDDLPLNRYFPSPCGSMISRTGWGRDAVVAEMRMIEQFVGNHQHHDAGTFQIYYKGPLATDSGYYSGSGYSYGCPHNNNYAKRTIAHNALLVYDPEENFGASKTSGKLAADGGQRMPEAGRQCARFELLTSDDYKYGTTLSHWYDDDFSLLKCDITPAYNSYKVRDVRRSFVFLNLHDKVEPAALVVFDHVVSTDKNFKKYFLLHSVDKAEIKGNSTTVSITREPYGGSLKCTTLIPSDPEITSVGGDGKEFWVFGRNYKMNNKPVPDEVSRWRTEICPSKASEEDCFLNVMQISDAGADVGEVRKVSGKGVVGVALAGRVVTFSADGAFLVSGFDFKAPVGGKMLLTDLSEGNWRVTLPGGGVKDFFVGPEDGKILVEGPSGKYSVVKL